MKDLLIGFVMLLIIFAFCYYVIQFFTIVIDTINNYFMTWRIF